VEYVVVAVEIVSAEDVDVFRLVFVAVVVAYQKRIVGAVKTVVVGMVVVDVTGEVVVVAAVVAEGVVDGDVVGVVVVGVGG
jgi:hypothetical protein